MNSFNKYQHLEKYGNDEVQNIVLGECYIFPKLDGTNGSIWLEDRVVCAGSRNRKLYLTKDNAGFYKWVLEQANIIEYLNEYPEHILYGEWLVPHTLKTYRENAWGKFYIFDVAIKKQENEITHKDDDKVKYLHYKDYKDGLEKYSLDFVPPIVSINNPSYDQLLNNLQRNTFLIEDGKGFGEGIVIKNYNFRNKYNRTVWAKIITNEFKEKHTKNEHLELENKLIEEEIIDKNVTEHFVSKIYAKISLEKEFDNKDIPRLLNTSYYDLINEELWSIVKDYKNPIINFKTLQYFCYKKTKHFLDIIRSGNAPNPD